jgi:integrase
VLTARWKDLDLERRIWTVEFNKTGTTRYIPISDGLLEMLSAVEQLRIPGCEWLFPNPKTLKPYNNIFNSWDVARKRAGMPELRLHDLRHSFASFLINSGRSLYEVQNILGHTQVKTTQRYAHLTQDSLIAAADTATRSLPSLSTMMPNRASQVALLEAR